MAPLFHRCFFDIKISNCLLKIGDLRASFLTTVDGSEIRRSPVEVKVVYPMIYKVLYIPSGA